MKIKKQCQKLAKEKGFFDEIDWSAFDVCIKESKSYWGTKEHQEQISDAMTFDKLVSPTLEQPDQSESNTLRARQNIGREWRDIPDCVSVKGFGAIPDECLKVSDPVAGKDYTTDDVKLNWQPLGEPNQKSFTTNITPPWDGEGLPPVGCECLCYCYEKDEYLKVKTLDAVTGSGEVAVASIRDDGMFSRVWWGCLFRPIETPEQNGISRIREILKDLAFATDGEDVKSDLAAELYRLGLRVEDDRN